MRKLGGLNRLDLTSLNLRPIEMENLRHDDNDFTTPNDALLQRYAQPVPPSNNEVQYAQILSRAPPAAANNDEQFDFRMQAPQTAASNNSLDSMSLPVMSPASSISSGYINVTQVTLAPLRPVRPTSPETSF